MDLTKVIDGVRTIVLFDVDVQDGKVIESELFFVAQDRDGIVWTLGEYPEEYDKASSSEHPALGSQVWPAPGRGSRCWQGHGSAPPPTCRV